MNEPLTVWVAPVHSRLSDGAELDRRFSWCPWPLYRHQLLTLEALEDPEVEVVFNTAMTGDGKSLAAYLPALLHDKSLLAMYPTNELIRDQARQVENYQRLLGTHQDVDTMFSEKLYEIRAEFDELHTQAKAIDWQTWQNRIVLTNPDIFNLIANFFYVAKHQPPDALFQRILERFDLFLFDEFHVYDAHQVNAVLASLLYVLEQTKSLPRHRRKKFLFLSATPSPMLVECLQRVGVSLRVIEGCYDFSETCPPGWRTILQPIQLHFHPVGRRTEEWVRENWTLIADWFQQHPHSRGALIVNSVAVAKRLIDFFTELKRSGRFPWTVSENTGLHKDPLDADLVIGTSTVDVGVDFRINFLIFEALDAGTWVQRLGRLGRHKEYTQGGQTLPFTAYAAHSLLPRYSYERLEERLKGVRRIDRAQLYALVKGEEETETEGIFSPINDFRPYRRSWGWLSAAHVLHTLRHPRLRENYAQTAAQLAQRYSTAYELEIEERLKWYAWLKENCQPLVDEAVLRFRGETPFDCGIWDETDDELKVYDLLWVLRHADVQRLSKTDFLQEVKRRGLLPARFRSVDLFFRLRGYLREPRRLQLHHRKAFLDEFQEADYRKLHVLRGFRVSVQGIPDINAINRVLERKPLLCLLSRLGVDELRARLRLPPLFPVYRLLDGQGMEFSVAFSKEALLLASQPLIFGGGEASHAEGKP